MMSNSQFCELRTKLTQCKICLQQYNRNNQLPYFLKCGHTFCGTCCQKLQEYNGIKCPFDQKVNKGSYKDLKINFYILDYVQDQIQQNKKDSLTQLTQITIQKLEQFHSQYQQLTKSRNYCLAYLESEQQQTLDKIKSAKLKCIDASQICQSQIKKQFIIQHQQQDYQQNYQLSQNSIIQLVTKLQSLQTSTRQNLSGKQLKLKTIDNSQQFTHLANQLYIFSPQQLNQLVMRTHNNEEEKKGYINQSIQNQNETKNQNQEIFTFKDLLNQLSFHQDQNAHEIQYFYDQFVYQKSIKNDEESCYAVALLKQLFESALDSEEQKINLQI